MADELTRGEIKDIIEGIFRVGAGPEPGERWVPVKPAPLGKLRPIEDESPAPRGEGQP